MYRLEGASAGYVDRHALLSYEDCMDSWSCIIAGDAIIRALRRRFDQDCNPYARAYFRSDALRQAFRTVATYSCAHVDCSVLLRQPYRGDFISGKISRGDLLVGGPPSTSARYSSCAFLMRHGQQCHELGLGWSAAGPEQWRMERTPASPQDTIYRISSSPAVSRPVTVAGSVRNTVWLWPEWKVRIRGDG